MYGSVWLCLTCVFCSLRLSSSDELVLVQMLIRHGDRTPTNLYPNDNNTEDTWPQGLGQLTKLGVEQQYQFGQYVRKQYIDDNSFLSPTYQREELYVRSTDLDRTLMSATSALQGLYPSSDGFPWQPIPVHTQRQLHDPMLDMDIPCQRFDDGFSEILHSEAGKKFISENEVFIHYVCKNAGWKNTTLQNTWNTYDGLAVEMSHNRTLPPWANRDIFDHLQHMYLKKLEFYYYTEDQRKIKAGVFLTELLNNSNVKAADGDDAISTKAFMYFAHDTTLAAVLASLQVWDGQNPPLVSAVIFELYETGTQDYALKILYKNTTDSGPGVEPVILILPGCTELCPLQTVQKHVSSLLIPDETSWSNYCDYTDDGNITKGGVVAVTIFCILFLIGLIVLFVWCYRHQQAEVRYSPANFAGDQNM